MDKKYITKEEREKLIQEEQERLGKRLPHSFIDEVLKSVSDEDGDRFDGIEDGFILDKPVVTKIGKHKHPVVHKFVKKGNKLKQVKIKDHYVVTKDMKVKARKKMAKRSIIIKKAHKKEQELLKKQKSSLNLVRRQTPKVLSSIERNISKKEVESFSAMTFDSLKWMTNLNKVSVDRECHNEITSFDYAILGSVEKIYNRMNKTLGEKFNKEELGYVIHSFLANYLNKKATQYAGLAMSFSTSRKPNTYGLPRVASHNIIESDSTPVLPIKSKHRKIKGTDVEIIMGEGLR